MNSNLTGITLIRNGNQLSYPWKLCIQNMCKYCEWVLVNIGDSTDQTLEDYLELENEYKNLIGFKFDWNMSNTGDGSELAKQANNLLSCVPPDSWVIYLQADEFIHEVDHEELVNLINQQPSNVSQIELYRTYFYGDLEHRLHSEELYLGRIFRIGTHRVSGDGMYLNRLSGDVYRSKMWIYHYSRIGTEEQVTQRVRNLDRLFHNSEVVDRFPDFKYENSKHLIPYYSTHPAGIKEFYRGNQ